MKGLINFLNNLEISSQKWWDRPISNMPFFANLKTMCETNNAKQLAETHLGLPLWKGIKGEQLAYVAESLTIFDQGV